MRATALLLLGLISADAAPAEDLVDVMPDFKKTPFNVYSGYLTVPGPIADYDELKIHYEFHESQGDPAKDPVATWHQGGPGSSSMFGAFSEMGYFQRSDKGGFVNPYAWNRIASMLYLESPAGSGGDAGYSECYRNGKVVACRWNDVTQAEAYSQCLLAFFKKFPEFKNNDLYLTGESYAGQYLPNIAAHILKHDHGALPNFKGIAVGNGCWGGDEHSVACNGPHEARDNLDLFHGKGMISKKEYDAAYSACFAGAREAGCSQKLNRAMDSAGPYNVYNLYDNCPGQEEALARANKTASWLLDHHRAWLHDPRKGVQLLKETLGGGYDWACGGDDGEAEYMTRPDVQEALHLGKPGRSGMDYDQSGPASVTLYPSLIGKIRVLIYNGDADGCVPYIGNEEWTTGMVAKGVVKEKKAWHPWYSPSQDKGAAKIAAGYATSYTALKGDKDFNFVTIRLAGHMVPTFQPAAAFDMLSNFLTHKEW